MKKIFAGILLLLVVAAVGIPFVNGLVMEKIVKKSFANLNAMYADTGSGISIAILRYDRKLTSTEIEWQIDLGTLQAIYGVKAIVFIDRAKHGYTGIVSETSLEKNKWFTDFVDQKLAGENPLAISTAYKLTGQINSTITLAAFTLPVEGDVVAVQPGRALLTWNEDLKNFSSETSWQGITVGDKLKVAGVSLNSDLEKMSAYLWDGTLSYAVASVQANLNNDQFQLDDFKGDYSLDIDKEENAVSVVTTFEAAGLQTGMKKMADCFIRIGLINMDAQGFEEFIKLYTQMTNTALSDFAMADDDPQKMPDILRNQLLKTRFQMLTAYEQLLKKGLELQISDLHARLPEGEIKGDVTISLNKDMTFAQFIPLLQQPELVLDIVSLQSEIILPAQLAGNDPRLLSPLYSGMQTGLFVKDGNELVHKAETRNGKLYLNGLEFRFH